MSTDNIQRLAVELHDFTPKYQYENFKILDELERIGITSKRIIHIVPNWGGKYNILDHKTFLDRIIHSYIQSDEIVLHGNTHVRESKEYPSFYQKFLGEWRYRGEAEFLATNYSDSIKKIQSSKNILFQAGFLPKVFVPPGWILSREAQQAAVDEGFEYLSLRTSLRKLNKPYEDIKMECLEFTARPRIADYIFRFQNFSLLHASHKERNMRFPIHPQDMLEDRTKKYLFELLSELSKIMHTTTFEEIISTNHEADRRKKQDIAFKKGKYLI
jgi:predicted deacetylase